MSDFEYLINSLDEKALSFCIENMYDIFHFNTLKKEEVRKIDLFEKFNDKRSWIPGNNDRCGYFVRISNIDNSSEQKRFYLESIIDYAILLHWFLDSNLMNCVKDSRAERYKEKAYQILSKIEKGEKDISYDLFEDLSTIFIIFLRRTDSYFKKPTGYLMKEIRNTKLQKNDLFNINRFFLQEHSFPPRSQLGLLGSIKYVANNPTKLMINKYDIEGIINFMYIYTVIFLSKGLQNMGDFLDNDKEATDE